MTGKLLKVTGLPRLYRMLALFNTFNNLTVCEGGTLNIIVRPSETDFSDRPLKQTSLTNLSDSPLRQTSQTVTLRHTSQTDLSDKPPRQTSQIYLSKKSFRQIFQTDLSFRPS